MQNILICDDERDIVSALKIYLTDNDHKIFEAYNGNQALDIVRENDIHVVLMDIMMPELDGINALTKIREISNVPVIFLSAKDQDCDKILGLNIGADDYITKPFNPVEVIARVKSALRRYTMLGSRVITREKMINGGIELDNVTKEIKIDGKIVPFTPKEFDILKLFMENPNQVFSIKQIYENVWNEYAFGCESTVAVHIRHIREKIEINPAEPRYLKVVWGQGYKMELIK
ncbi:MAG: response regulator transcription factor [Clostridia bacterium]